jgi:pimeloyl-ACP methyl ester carboxylesterase
MPATCQWLRCRAICPLKSRHFTGTFFTILADKTASRVSDTREARYVAPQLASNRTVICVDLRGYGRSGVPDSTEDHSPYTKRVMGDELVALMNKLGFAKFDLVGHDRGGRVSYRLTLDHPERVQRLAVFDVIPISDAWSLAAPVPTSPVCPPRMKFQARRS